MKILTIGAATGTQDGKPVVVVSIETDSAGDRRFLKFCTQIHDDAFLTLDNLSRGLSSAADTLRQTEQ